MENDPFLPPELEREIFELAARLHPNAIPILLRVAQRVHCWIGPMLYHVLRLEKGHIVKAIERILDSKPIGLLQNAVRHAVVDRDRSCWHIISIVLDMNRSIHELAICGYSDLYNRSQALSGQVRPQRLILDGYSSARIFSDPMLTSVSHLTILERDFGLQTVAWENWSGLAELPALTHLCLTANISRIILPDVLKKCPMLRAVVTTWLVRADSRARVDAFSYVLVRPDARVVVTDLPYFYGGWEKGAWSGDDLWLRVDDFIARKRQGEIPASTYLLEDSLPYTCAWSR
ncbi:hypothetical protein DFH06DRAFT_1173101 [Mycena polygramma]|nr:hypothetical protein DFH06DRAFT_1173101 [Mycena polygramma]